MEPSPDKGCLLSFPNWYCLYILHISRDKVSQEQLYRAFAHFPGLEYCDLKKDKRTGESKGFAYINYSTPEQALLARDKMDGVEFPPGNPLKVIFAEPLGVKSDSAVRILSHH